MKRYKCLVCLSRVHDHLKHYEETKHKRYEYFNINGVVVKVNIK